VTGSVGLLSDALESVVNLVSACVALVVLTIAARPADEDHPYGHDKAEYFSSGFEGGIILIAALGIAGAAIDRLLHLQPLQHLRSRTLRLADRVGHQLCRCAHTAHRRPAP
jgi:P-type Ca2+ transporter type 2C